ncbi:type III secretion protein D [Bradyrhizobium sp. USDA 3397]
MNEPNCLYFEVLSGCYSGLTSKVRGGSCLIGSSLDADLIFVEQGLEPRHLRVTPHSNSIEIEALARDVRIEGHETVLANEPIVVPLPVVLHAGAMSIRWTIEDNKQAGSINRRRIPLAVLTFVLISSAAVGAVSSNFVQTDTTVASSRSSPATDIAPKLALSAPDALATDAAAERLQEEVDRAGLVSIKVGSGAGVVTADGTVTPASLATWRDVQQRFDQNSNGAYTLVNAVAIKVEKTPPAIEVQAVWRGSEPYIVIAGQKYFVGALLSNGWTVCGIEEGRVLLSRDGRLATLPY